MEPEFFLIHFSLSYGDMPEFIILSENIQNPFFIFR
jgi:hypothetical protein